MVAKSHVETESLWRISAELSETCQLLFSSRAGLDMNIYAKPGAQEKAIIRCTSVKMIDGFSNCKEK